MISLQVHNSLILRKLSSLYFVSIFFLYLKWSKLTNNTYFFTYMLYQLIFLFLLIHIIYFFSHLCFAEKNKLSRRRRNAKRKQALRDETGCVPLTADRRDKAGSVHDLTSVDTGSETPESSPSTPSTDSGIETLESSSSIVTSSDSDDFITPSRRRSRASRPSTLSTVSKPLQTARRETNYKSPEEEFGPLGTPFHTHLVQEHFKNEGNGKSIFTCTKTKAKHIVTEAWKRGTILNVKEERVEIFYFHDKVFGLTGHKNETKLLKLAVALNENCDKICYPMVITAYPWHGCKATKKYTA